MDMSSNQSVPSNDPDSPQRESMHQGGTAEPTADAVPTPWPRLDASALTAGGILLVGAAAILWRDDKVRSICMAVVSDPRVKVAWSSALTATTDAWHQHGGTEACFRALAKWR